MRRKNRCNSDRMSFNDPLRSSPPSIGSMSSEESSTVSNNSDTAPLVVRSNASTSKRSGNEPKQPNHIFNLDNVGNNHFRDKENRKYCRSYSKNLIKVISQWTCAHCEDQKFDKYNLPMIISCGHYVSARCVRVEFGVSGNFFCSICRDYLPQKQEFLHDEVLSDFFNAIEKGGYKCLRKECDSMNDPTNIVHFPCGGDSKYWCVWCASKNHQDVDKFKASLNLDLALTTTSSATERLVSLNRIEHDSGWALDACCICREELRNKKDVDIVCLPCKHIGHKVCPGDAKNPNDMVNCLLCIEERHPVNRNTLAKRKWHGTHYLKEYAEEKYFECGTCYQSHPESNLYPPSSTAKLLRKVTNSVKCVWCTVESFGP